MSNGKEVRKYFIIAVLVTLSVLCFFLIKPFIIPILSALILAYIFYPIYNKINQLTKKETISALITTLLILLVISLPLIFVANTFAKQSHTIYLLAKQNVAGGFICPPESAICDKISEMISLPQIQVFLLNALGEATNFILSYTATFILKIPKFIIGFFIMLFTIFYAFKDGKKFINNLFKWIPLKEKNKEHLRKRIDEVTAALIYGIMIIAIIQGLVAMVGFYIFNVPSPLFWGIIMILLSVIPFTGSWLVWFPAAMIKMVGGDFNNGVGLLLYGLLIVSTIDNIIRPKIVGSRAKIHPLTVLIGVVGGMFLFGIIGIILGPLLLEIFLVFLSIYREK